MRKSWRAFIVIALAGVWPQVGCHQLPANKSIQEGPPPIQKGQGAVNKQQMTAEDIGVSLVAQAKALEDAKKPGEAVAMYEKIRTSDQSQAMHATKRIAFLYLCNNELDRAEQEYQALLQRNPNDADALYSLGDIASRRGQFGIAEKFFRDALARRPDHSHAQISLGLTLAQNGDRAGCLDAFKKAGFSESDSYCQFGAVMKVNGKREEAMSAFEQALRCDPRCGRAKMEMEQLYRQDPELPVRVPAPEKSGKLGSVDLLPAPPSAFEGIGRSMTQRATLTPLPDLQIPASEASEWPVVGKKR